MIVLIGLTLACSSSPADEQQGEAAGRGGNAGTSATHNAGTGGGAMLGGGRTGTGGTSTGAAGLAGASGGRAEAIDPSSGPPCSPADNTVTITSEELSDLPTELRFNIYDPPASPRFTGNASNGDIHVQLAEPVRMNRVFTTDMTPDPLDRHAASIDLVLDGGVFNVNYFAQSDGALYAQVESGRVVLTFCGLQFFPATVPPGPVLTMSGRLVSATP
jgi:hypothetical protein